jgi:ubiquinone/menaquinone biosynthesis C-methylase UbiE
MRTHDARHKVGQATHFDHAVAPEFEVERPHGAPALYRFLIGQKLRRSVRALRAFVPGATALVVCGGSGMEAEFLARLGAQVICSDLSPGAARRAAERARRHGVSMTVLVADVERLPFADRSVDLVYVHDGLHHVAEPLRGLREMARVAGRAVSVNEPARAAVTRLAVRLGWARMQEEAGNPVMRLARAEVATLLAGCGFAVAHAERYVMSYRHEPGRLCALLSRRGWLPAAVSAWWLLNALIGRFGNKLTVQAVRRGSPASYAGRETLPSR